MLSSIGQQGVARELRHSARLGLNCRAEKQGAGRWLSFCDTRLHLSALLMLVPALSYPVQVHATVEISTKRTAFSSSKHARTCITITGRCVIDHGDRL